MYPYRIRLRGPWECEPLASSSGAPLPRKCRMEIPCRWKEGGLGDFAGTVRFRRHFGYPSRIEAHERLWLTFAGIAGSAEVSLNGQLLGKQQGADGPFEFEVTRLLQERNDLTLDVAAESDGGIWGEVALEVRCPAFLRNVRFSKAVANDTASLQATGEVVGQSDDPLELYLVLEGKTLTRIPVQATQQGTPFDAKAEGLRVRIVQPGQESTSRMYKVRIDLVSGSVVWYMVEEVLEFRR